MERKYFTTDGQVVSEGKLVDWYNKKKKTSITEITGEIMNSIKFIDCEVNPAIYPEFWITESQAREFYRDLCGTVNEGKTCKGT